MSVKKHRDPVTGHQITGHEWNGITELNTPVPKVVWFFIAATAIWSLVMWILMPTWPFVSGYTKGILGIDQRDEVKAEVQAASLSRADWVSQIDSIGPEQILTSAELMPVVRNVGHQLFGDNCAGCHGRDATGGPGFPSLTDSAWLWGGNSEAIMETLRVGINAQHPDTRQSQMLAFGHDGILSRDDIRAVTAHVLSLSGQSAANEPGAQIFADNCVSCHMEDGTGSVELGAPDLSDAFWIYGGDKKTIFKTVFNGRAGVMPAWEERFSPVERKVLTAYILDKQEDAE